MTDFFLWKSLLKQQLFESSLHGCLDIYIHTYALDRVVFGVMDFQERQ